MMAEYKQADQLIPGDIYISRVQRRAREQTYRVVAVRPGVASTVIDVTVVTAGRRPRTFVFYRGNRVEMADSRGLHFVRLAGED